MNTDLNMLQPVNPMSESNLVSMFSTDPAAVAAAESAKARIQAAYIMALRKPRNYDNARLRILKACQRPEFAEKVEYQKPAGGNNFISGPSIRFAELALREWGNISYENQVIFDDANVRRIRVTVTDMETNATFSKEIQLTKAIERKSSKGREVISERLNSYGDKIYLVKATEDEVQTREAALISKALRNEGLRLIPQEIIEESITTARTTMQSADKKDPDAARKRLTEVFFARGVEPTELEKYLGHPLAQCQPIELQELRTIYLAIKDGEATWASFMEKKEAERAEKDQSKGNEPNLMEQIMNSQAPAASKRAPKPQRAIQPKEMESQGETVVPEVIKGEDAPAPVEVVPSVPDIPPSSGEYRQW